VDALIANKVTHWKAEDKEWLVTQEESAIDKMFPKEGPKVGAIEVNADEVLSTFKATLKTVEDYTALMPEAMKAKVSGGVKLYTEHRVTLVKSIMDNTKEVWKEDSLNAMDDQTLENVAKSIQLPADYSAQGAGGGQGPTTGEEVIIPAEYSERKEDK